MRIGMAGAAGALSFFLVLSAAQAQPNRGNGWDSFVPQAPAVDQSGRREWTWQGGSALSYGGPGRLRYEPGGSPRIIVTGDPAIVETIEVDHGDIRRRNGNFFNMPRFNGDRDTLEIVVRGVTLDQFTLSGSATMDLGRLQRDTLRMQLNGSGSINAQGQARTLNLQVNGSGNARLDQMTAESASIAVNGSGNITMGAISEGGDIRLTGSGKADIGDVGRHLNIAVTGSGNARLGRVDTISAKLTGSGTVRVGSAPRQADYDITGSGRVLQVGPDGKVTELARMKRPDVEQALERAQRDRDRALQQAERARDRALAQAERERERALQRAEQDRERELERAERERERARDRAERERERRDDN